MTYLFQDYLYHETVLKKGESIMSKKISKKNPTYPDKTPIEMQQIMFEKIKNKTLSQTNYLRLMDELGVVVIA